MKNKEHKVKIILGNGSPLVVQNQGRNEKCSCGSGKKSKKCCNIEKFYSTKKIENELHNK